MKNFDIVSDELIKQIFEHKKKKQSLLIKNLCMDVPNWQDFMDHLEVNTKRGLPNFRDESTFNENEVEAKSRIVGAALVKNVFYIYLQPRHGNFIFHPSIEKIQNQFNEKFSKLGMTGGGYTNSYINLSSSVPDIAPHPDPQDNFYWQCIGSVEWTREDGGSGNSFVVEPGDMVYIPAGSMHSVKFSMPRAAVGFSWILDEANVEMPL